MKGIRTLTGLALAAALAGCASDPYHYQYDSCRTPFRIALDWCWFGETRARDYLLKTSNFFSGIGAANTLHRIDKQVQHLAKWLSLERPRREYAGWRVERHHRRRVQRR